MVEREAYVKLAVAYDKVVLFDTRSLLIGSFCLCRYAMFQAMEASNKFTATLEKRMQDVPHSDELYEIKKVI